MPMPRQILLRATSDVLMVAGGAVTAWLFVQHQWLPSLGVFVASALAIGWLRARA